MRKLFLAFMLLAILGPARAHCDIVVIDALTFDTDPSIVSGADQASDISLQFDITEGTPVTFAGITFAPYTINSVDVIQDGVSIGNQGIDIVSSEFASTDFGPDSFAITLEFDGEGSVFNVAGTFEAGLDGTFGDLDSFFDGQTAGFTFSALTGTEFTGNFVAVPEPGTTFGLLALGGFFAFRRKK